MLEKREIFKVTEDITPSEMIHDKITNTKSISKTIAKEKNKVIRNIMFGIESNFNDDGSNPAFKRIRKVVLDNINDLERYFKDEILAAIYNEANGSIGSLVIRISELEIEKRALLELLEDLNEEKQNEDGD